MLDLDDILANVDEESYSESRKEELRKKEKMARKQDRSVVHSNEPPEYCLKEIITSDDVKDFKEFRDGVIANCQKHELTVKNMKHLLSELANNPDLIGTYEKVSYAAFSKLEKVEDAYDQLVTLYSADVLKRKSRKDYPVFFGQDELDNNKMDFLSIKDLFLGLRKFNTTVFQNWNEYLQIVGAFNLIPNGNKAFHDLNVAFEPINSFMELTRKFYTCLAVYLGLKLDSLDVLEIEINKKIVYNTDFIYTVENILFKISDLINGKKELSNNDVEDLVNEKENVVEEDVSLKQKIVANVTKNVNDNFTIKGTKQWNSCEPYLLKIKEDKLKYEKQIIENALFINYEQGITSEQELILVKRNILSVARNQNNNNFEVYQNNLRKEIILITQNFMGIFNFEEDLQRLLMYHFGVLNLYNFMLNKLKNDNYFYIHLRQGKQGENKVVKKYPEEIIKFEILNWYEENINSLDLDFDSVLKLNEIKRKVTAFYQEDLVGHAANINNIIEDVRKKTGRMLTGRIVVKKKAPEWFGLEKCYLYNRFSNPGLLD